MCPRQSLSKWLNLLLDYGAKLRVYCLCSCMNAYEALSTLFTRLSHTISASVAAPPQKACRSPLKHFDARLQSISLLLM